MNHFVKHIDIINAKHIVKFSKYVIAFELIFTVIAIFSYMDNPVNSFNYIQYIFMYIFLASASFYMSMRSRRFLKVTDDNNYQKLVTVFAGIFILWGMVISLMDQGLYGHLNAYYINMAAMMALIYLPEKVSNAIYIGSAGLLFLLLPLFQKDTDVLVGHYVNTIVFVIFMVVATRVHYNMIYKHYHIRDHLKQKILENNDMHQQLQEAVHKLETLVIQDDLTKLPNRRGFESYISRLSAIEYTDETTYSLLMIDIDFFKEYNDFYGHIQGDETLVAIAGVLKKANSSLSDYIIRYGGEEFLQISVGKTTEEIMADAETIRDQVKALEISHAKSKCCDFVTVSIGISHGHLNELSNIGDVLKRADQALYLAKSNGRNQTAIA